MKSLRASASLILLAITLVASARTASGQCGPGWVYGPEQGWPGVNAELLALLEWDPDGTGPAERVLVAGGKFSAAGTVTANGIAVWDGERWAALSNGTGSASYRVQALAVYQNELVAGGRFVIDGTEPINAIMRWDGAAWRPLGGGITGGTSPVVNALTVYNGELIAGGDFTIAGGATASRIAAWNGTSWRDIGTINQPVRALTVYNGELVAGGDFTLTGGVSTNKIARWNGIAWMGMAGGVTSTSGTPVVRALTVHQGELIAGGLFTDAGGVPASRIAAWDGASWKPLGTGTSQSVSSLYTQGSRLVAGGAFLTAGGIAAKRIAVWDGASWGDLSGGFDRAGNVVNAIAEYRGETIAGGLMEKAGTEMALNIARLTESGWRPICRGQGNELFALYESAGTLYAGGFQQADGPERALVRWTGDNWAVVGGGLDGTVYDITDYGPGLAVAGGFSRAGDLTLGRVALWDGAAWQRLGDGVDLRVTALLGDGNTLYAGGGFRVAGGAPALRIARWDGQTWSPLSTGMDGPTSPWVSSIIKYNGEIIAAGQFATAGGVAAANIARWDGQNWHPLGAGTNDYVYALAIFGGDLIAAGKFTTAGGVTANRIAQWDGTTWSPLGSGITEGNWILDLTFYRGDLIAMGDFWEAGGEPSFRVARWNGTQWAPIPGTGFEADTPLSARINAMAVHGDELFLGGWFYTVDGNVSASIARWSDNRVPWVAGHPQDVGPLCASAGIAGFSVTPASGLGELEFRWRRETSPGEFTPLSDGPTAWGSMISGSSTPELAITAAGVGDVGGYDCVVSNTCGSGSSRLVLLSVCAVDFNCDGVVDFGDYLEFLNLFDALDPRADLNLDGLVDFADYLEFLNLYDAGC